MSQQQVQTRPGNGPGKSTEAIVGESITAPDSKEAIAKADAAIQEALASKDPKEPTLEEKLAAIKERFGCCFKG